MSLSDPQTAPTLPGKREAILAAATGHFTRFGYRRTSMDDIARAAGVAKGTLYLYFDSKAAVFRAMQLANFEQTEIRCQTAVDQGETFLDRLNGLLQANYGWMHAQFGGSEFLAELGDARSTVGADIADLSDRAYVARIADLFYSADRSGDISLARTGLSGEGFAATILAAARGAKSGPAGGVSPEDYALSLRQIAVVAFAAVEPRP
jgi:AcrR family transcriptional regulator